MQFVCVWVEINKNKAEIQLRNEYQYHWSIINEIVVWIPSHWLGFVFPHVSQYIEYWMTFLIFGNWTKTEEISAKNL